MDNRHKGNRVAAITASGALAKQVVDRHPALCVWRRDRFPSFLFEHRTVFRELELAVVAGVRSSAMYRFAAEARYFVVYFRALYRRWITMVLSTSSTHRSSEGWQG
jgi:hypothetical protein